TVRKSVSSSLRTVSGRTAWVPGGFIGILSTQKVSSRLYSVIVPAFPPDAHLETQGKGGDTVTKTDAAMRGWTGAPPCGARPCSRRRIPRVSVIPPVKLRGQ